MRIIGNGGSQESEIGKGLKQAKAKQVKEKGQRRSYQCGLGRTPIQLAPLPVHRPQPKSQAGAGRWGALFIAPAHCPHRGPPPSPPQGTHEMAL